MSEPTIDFPSKPSTEQAAPNLPGIQSAYLGPASSASASATGGGGGGGVITTAFPGSPTDGERFTLTDSTSSPTWLQDFVYNSTIGAWLGVGTARGTSLPASPKEGMQAILTDSLAAPTWNWLFWYSTAAAKWLFVGGSAAFAEVLTQEGTTSGTYTDLSTVGPSISIPNAGLYEVTVGAAITTSAAIIGRAAVKIGAAATSNNQSVIIDNPAAAAGGTSVARTMQITFAAADVAKVQYLSGTGGTNVNFANRFISVRPVTVT